jgi:multiple sugar transport system ATP-binding protein
VAPSERGVAMVFQSYALFPHMTVYDNIGFGLKLAKTPKLEMDRRVREAARVLQLDALLERKPKELSGGQRQRVAIGRAIVRDPKVFLFDEPLSNLDAALRVQTRIEIAKLHRELGATTIYVTHDQVEAMTLADRVVVLRDGRVEQHGTPLELYDHPANRFVAQFIGTPSMNVVAASALPALANGAGGAGFLGIRPEHVHLNGHAHDGLPATVDMVESLGVETLVYARLENDVQIVSRGSERTGLHPGDRTWVTFDPGAVHHFDQAGNAEAGAHP